MTLTSRDYVLAVEFIQALSLKVLDARGDPVALGTISWESTDHTYRSLSSKVSNSKGEVTFSNVPTTELRISLIDGITTNGVTVSGQFRIQALDTEYLLEIPEIPEIANHIVSVQHRSGLHAAFVEVQSIGLSQSSTVSNSSFDGLVTLAQRNTALTDSNGKAKFTGFVIGDVKFRALYTDSQTSQATEWVEPGDQRTTLTFSNLPRVQLGKLGSLVVAKNTLVAIPIEVLRDTDLQRMPNVDVSIVPPVAGAANTCKGRARTRVQTNALGKGTLLVCATVSGEYKVQSDRAISFGSIFIYVKGTKPMQVADLTLLKYAPNSLKVTWSIPRYSGSTSLTSFNIKATSGTLTREVILKNTSAGFKARQAVLASLSGNRTWKVYVYAINKYGTSMPASAESLVTGNSQFQLTPTPIIEGKFDLGQTLIARVGTWDPQATLTFQWLRNGEPIPESNNRSYQLRPEDRGKYISIQVNAGSENFDEITRSSTPKLFMSTPVSPNSVILARKTQSVVTVKWDPPSNTGGSAITSYVVIIQSGITSKRYEFKSGTREFSKRMFDFSGVSSTMPWTFKVFARNKLGLGDPKNAELVAWTASVLF